ncbi:MAG: hypothetical protein N2321_10270 [Melioribacteraceae bacterium]|nr:hypothetical protein [Melioribacteraceae bacterium]
MEKITENEPVVKIYQDGKCRNYGLNKINNDSLCFDYKFDKSLSINFCVKGNCCPDSNRFIFNYKLNNSQIEIFVDDVAPNLCKCICTYVINAEINGLLNKKYTVTCYIKNNNEYKLLHKREIGKN